MLPPRHNRHEDVTTIWACRRHGIGKISSHMLDSVRTSTQLEIPLSESRKHTSRVRETCFVLAHSIRKTVSLMEDVHITRRAVLYVPPPATTFAELPRPITHPCMQQVPSTVFANAIPTLVVVFHTGTLVPATLSIPRRNEKMLLS